jgi:hypothetical protein
MRPASLIALVSLLALSAAVLSACETTQETSQRLSKNARKLLNVQGVKITKLNASVKVVARAVLHDANGVAAVVFVHNSGEAQAKVPVGIAVRDAKGRSLYSNSIPGLDPSLTSMPAIARGQSTFWVNNQITTAKPPHAVSAQIGVAGARAPGDLPRMEISKVTFGHDTSGLFARGVIANHSKIVQRRLVVSCVSRHGDRVAAAGRAIVDRLNPAPTPKPVTFRVYFIGNASGGKLSCAAPPTVLEGGQQ